jgi:hypothetical protein
MSYRPDPDNDLNEAYAVIPMPAELRGPADWWTVTRTGVPVRHYSPQAHDLAMRFATDPTYRQQLASMSANASPDWSRAFDDPITVPDGHVLKTLHDAGHYATALPKGVQERAEWQTAAEMLILAAQGQRPVMFADIAMRRALHAHTSDRPPAPRRKR